MLRTRRRVVVDQRTCPSAARKSLNLTEPRSLLSGTDNSMFTRQIQTQFGDNHIGVISRTRSFMPWNLGCWGCGGNLFEIISRNKGGSFMLSLHRNSGAKSQHNHSQTLPSSPSRCFFPRPILFEPPLPFSLTKFYVQLELPEDKKDPQNLILSGRGYSHASTSVYVRTYLYELS